MFWADYKGNRESIQAMTQSIRQNKSFIESGDVKVRVLGFCSSHESAKENLATAKNRSNQVKSYFIVHEGLKEEHFRTTNSTRRWRDLKDVIAVAYLFETENHNSSTSPGGPQDTTSRISPEISNEKASPPTPSTTAKPDLPAAEKDNRLPAQENSQAQATERDESAEDSRPYRLAIKTNMAYLAATVANVGIEYSFGQHYSVDLPVIYSPYTVARNYRLRFLAVQPEVRYWLHNPMQGHFFGAHLSLGTFNISVDSKTRYQSPDGFYGIGLSYGYVLPLTCRWAAEFTIGAGYVHTKYDSYYNIPNGARYEKGIHHNYWGLTKVGIGLAYRFGK